MPKDYQAIVDVFADVPGVSCSAGWAKGNTVLKSHGSIFAMLAHGHLVVKLPAATVDARVRDGTGARFDPKGTGKGMREWCEIATDQGNWPALAQAAYAFVAKAPAINR
ncbi:MAG: hypothetical protein V4858_22820 [Pseudomonadota bacterium]